MTEMRLKITESELAELLGRYIEMDAEGDTFEAQMESLHRYALSIARRMLAAETLGMELAQTVLTASITNFSGPWVEACQHATRRFLLMALTGNKE